MESLTSLANKHGSDKGDLRFEAHNYTPIYEDILNQLPDDLSILEIGVYDHRFPGASPAMWRDFRPKAKLYGFDINPNAISLEATTGMKIFMANQSDLIAQSNAAISIGPVDFIVDDGSHRVEHITNSLLVLWKNLKSGGYYIIEDLHVVKPADLYSLTQLAQFQFGKEIAFQKLERGNKLLILKKI